MLAQYFGNFFGQNGKFWANPNPERLLQIHSSCRKMQLFEIKTQSKRLMRFIAHNPLLPKISHFAQKKSQSIEQTYTYYTSFYSEFNTESKTFFRIATRRFPPAEIEIYKKLIVYFSQITLYGLHAGYNQNLIRKPCSSFAFRSPY